ncbi:MAG: hypothetical protein K0Q93_2514 [Nocardioidaceae bacterium]|jgi:hypothetical protein|nr:hypothetical protein [Nocardioidaceae bacterium]
MEQSCDHCGHGYDAHADDHPFAWPPPPLLVDVPAPCPWWCTVDHDETYTDDVTHAAAAVAPVPLTSFALEPPDQLEVAVVSLVGSDGRAGRAHIDVACGDAGVVVTDSVLLRLLAADERAHADRLEATADLYDLIQRREAGRV